MTNETVPRGIPQTPSSSGWEQLTFSMFSSINRDRCESPEGFNHSLASWTTSDWFTAIVGELGEAANVAKKLNRVRDGIPGNKENADALREKLRRELGDVFVYLDLLAQSLGFSIGTAAVEVFNAKSAELGSPFLIDAAHAADASQIAQMRSELKDAHQLYDEGKALVAALSAQVEQLMGVLYDISVSLANTPRSRVTLESAIEMTRHDVQNLVNRLAESDAEVEQLRQEKDAYRRDFEAELAGNGEMRRRLGAHEDETMFAFVDRLENEHAALRQQVESLQGVIANLLSDLPETWGDKVQHGRIELLIDAEAIDAAVGGITSAK